MSVFFERNKKITSYQSHSSYAADYHLYSFKTLIISHLFKQLKMKKARNVF